MEITWLKIIWLHLAALRFMLCILPQTGYIFPDEFFQSPEVTAGDIFGYSNHLTWEWNAKNPARSIIFPYLSSGVPFLLLKGMLVCFDFTITPYSLILFPRIWMTLQSYLADHLIYKIANNFFDDEALANTAAIIFASSYTSWVYCTRTFSNATELILLALLLHFVTSSYENNKKKRAQLQSHWYRNAHLISVVVVSGTFIRTSFLAFALVPVLYWMFKPFDQVNVVQFYKQSILKLALLAPAAILTCIVFVFCDCFYFQPDKFLQFLLMLPNIHSIISWVRDLPLTPLNIMQYNLVNSNLEKHGLHPWYTHAVVNLPMLFGPLIYTFIRGLFVKRPKTTRSVTEKDGVLTLLLGTFVCGLAMLSYIPHHEPRYILPLVIPISIISAKFVHPISSHKFLTTLWVGFNLVCFVMFGIVHQGGLLPCMEYIHSMAKAHSELRPQGVHQTINVYFYKTYMPPVHLLAWRNNNAGTDMHVIDLAGKDYKVLASHLNSALSIQHSHNYLVIPASLPCNHFMELHRSYDLEVYFQFFPHFSGEDLPRYRSDCDPNNKVETVLLQMIEQFSLRLYKVKPSDHERDRRVLLDKTTSKVRTSVM